MLVTKLGSPIVLFHAAEEVAVVPPSAPTLVSATPSVGHLTLAWVAPSDRGGAPTTAYQVLRGVTSGTETLHVTLSDVLAYTDLCEQQRTYFYKVKAVNSAGAGDASNEESGAPLPTPFELVPVSPGSLSFPQRRGGIAPGWRPDTDYVAGQLVQPSTTNGHIYQSWQNTGTSGSSEPSFPTDGSTVDDGSVVWKDLGALSLTPTVWQPDTPYADGALVTPPTPNGHTYVIYPQYPGTSGSWPHGGQADPWTAPYSGSDDQPAGADWPTGGPADQGYSGLDGEVYWQDLGAVGAFELVPATPGDLGVLQAA